MPRAPDTTPAPLTSVTGIDPKVTLAAAFPFLSPPTRPGDLGRFGPYPVRRLVGAGAAGFVFEAFDHELARAVVLKVLRPELAADPEHRRRFVREAKAAAAVHSDHTVHIFAVGEHAGLPFLEMPLLVGETVQTRLARAGVLQLTEALQIARQTALGLADAHAVGLIHRDIKPANLWVEPNAAGGVKRVRLLDFGLARTSARTGSVTQVGGVMGTPHYMSPEQAQGDPMDARSDLFSLGVTLYALLTGTMPFRGSSVTATLVASVTQPHVPIADVNPAVPPAVAGLIDRLLAKRPHDRPASAGEVADDLTAILLDLGAEIHLRGLSATVPPPAPRFIGLADAPRSGEHPTLPRPTPPAPPAPPRGRGLRWLMPFAAVLCVLVAVVVARWPAFGVGGNTSHAPDPSPIRVGVLHSQSGTMKLSEDPVIDATVLAIDEVNAAGGVMGRKLVPVVVDGKSDPDVFAAEADRLLTHEKAAVIFGCWTSSSRKAVRPVVERHGGLLFYPVQYEGLEQSPAVVYLGHAPNQQLLPAVDFLVAERKAKRLYLVGSDYVFPRSAHRIIRDHVEANHGGRAEVVGEGVRPLGDENWPKVVADLLAARPDAVLNTVNGSSAFAFYRELREQEKRLGRSAVPVLSVSITANELAALPDAMVAGDYLAGTHFDLPDEPSHFREAFRRRFGADRPTTDMMAAAYTGVHLWAEAANAAASTDPKAVRAAVGGRGFDGPVGRVTVDPENYHLWQPARVARVKGDGGLELAFAANGGRPVHPEPFPPTRTRPAWDRFLKELQLEYGGRWLATPAK